jgi:hypothetical protein
MDGFWFFSATLAAEIARMKAEIDGLTTYQLPADPRIEITYKGLFTLLDGKGLNAVTGNRNSQACPICHAGSVEMCTCNHSFEPKLGSLDHGFASLHFGIRAMEFFLHIGFNQDFKHWQARGDYFKLLHAKKKSEIQKFLQDAISVRVFEVRLKLNAWEKD